MVKSVATSKTVTLTIVCITALVSTFMMSAVEIAVPTIAKEFAMPAVLSGWVVTAMNLPQVAILLAAGRLADIYGRKKIYFYGTLLLTITSVLCAIASSSATIISYRVLQGISGGMVFGTSTALVTSVFPTQERGRALGISVSAAFLGLTIGPFLGGVLTQHLGWRSIFYLTVFLCLMVLGLMRWKLRGEWAEARGEKLDITGSTVLGISLVVLLYGFTEVNTATGIILVIVGILGLFIFVKQEARVTSPILNINVFRTNKLFVFSNVATLVQYLTAFAATFLMSLYLQYTLGFSPQTAGLIMLAHPVVMTVFSPIAGRLSDRIEPRLVASAGMAVLCISMILYVFLGEATPLGYIIAVLAISGLGSGLFSSPNSNAIMGSVEKKFLGVASGTQGTMRATGQMLGMGIVMILFSIFIGETQIMPENYPAFLISIKMAFIIFSVINFGGIIAQLVGGKAIPVTEKVAVS